MSQELHQTAQRLILQERVEGLSEPDRDWLRGHLEGCAECARRAGSTADAVRRFRTISVPLPPDLAGRAQLRVYLRAGEMRQREYGWILWTACISSWLLGLFSAPYVWKGFQWLGVHAGAPALVWKAAFLFWWTLPGMLTAAGILIEKWKREKGSDDAGIL